MGEIFMVHCLVFKTERQEKYLQFVAFTYTCMSIFNKKEWKTKPKPIKIVIYGGGAETGVSFFLVLQFDFANIQYQKQKNISVKTENKLRQMNLIVSSW